MSRVTRNRYYWPSFPVDVGPSDCSVTRVPGEVFDEIILHCVPLDFERTLPKDHYNLQPLETTIPTLTLTIERQRPPPSPAGLSKLNASEYLQYEKDGFRYPPFMYHANHGVC